MQGNPAEERVLRAKYFDWCSARVAERFLRLSPDQIYELAQQEKREPAEQRTAVGSAGGVGIRGANGGDGATSARAGGWTPRAPMAEGASYWMMVSRVSEVLARDLALPSFEDWRVAYLHTPDQFDTELLGLWREAV